ncbi:MAG: hypothetical protein JSU87_10960 [Gemmatimonadota bacterium]|nr:MAG: hypothetical protein JSU87_10960 [Gemmatimonadota bacterium]
MATVEFGLLLAVAAVSAAIGQFLTGYSRGGCPVSFVSAAIGAYLGPLIAERMGWAEPFLLTLAEIEFPVITSAAGALALVILVNLLTKKRKF